MNTFMLNDLMQFLADHDEYLILIHEKPDGDAVGSGTALALFLQSLGKKAAVLSPTAIPERLAFVKADGVDYLAGAEGLQQAVYETVVTVDVASPELLPGMIGALRVPVGYVIDHHRMNTLEAEKKFVEETAAAAGEIVFSLLEFYAGVTGQNCFTPAVCKALYAAVSSDTGCFRYGNTTSESHTIAAKLLSTGVDAETINRLLFDTKPLTQIKVEALGYEKLETFYGGRLALAAVTLADLAALNASEEDTETLSQCARTVAGVQIGVLMREKKTDDGVCYKFSVRANADTDVSALCAVFGGGGHKKAAGCTIHAPFSEAKARFVKEAEKYLID